MTLYTNPYYARAAEQLPDVAQYVQTFGPGALDMLPQQLWDRVLILRSSPGAGKTSLLRMFTVESLKWVERNTKPTEPIRQELSKRGVISDSRLNRLGVLINLDRDYRSLLDLPLDEEKSKKLFLRLLDMRILVSTMRALLLLVDKSYPRDVGQISFGSDDGAPAMRAAIDKIGGPQGDSVLDYAQRTETELLGMLDALLPSQVDSDLAGHVRLHSLEILSQPTYVDGELVDARTLLMFDDGHRLEATQRQTLLEQLGRRDVDVARWYAERFEALSDQELLSGLGPDGRDHVTVNLDGVARKGSSHGNFRRGRHNRVLEDIARRRATKYLASYADESQDFIELLEDAEELDLGSRQYEIRSKLKERVLELAGGDARYEQWIKTAADEDGLQSIIRWRELEIMIHRDQDRHPGLFEEELATQELRERSSAAVREGAAVLAAREFALPYYGGPDTLVRLATHNVQQFLQLCGDMFAEMLVDISLGRRPFLPLDRQHRVILEASESYWEEIPRSIPHGRDVQSLVKGIVDVARLEMAKPTLPYPPGVTGTAIRMGERKQLLDNAWREKHPNSERLFAALASAVAHNVLVADIDYSVKGGRFMVLYLNRLLCPRFWLPLAYGAFRERRLRDVLGWLDDGNQFADQQLTL